MKTSITFSGGFHNSGDLTIRAEVGANGIAHLSRGQYRKLQKHFCGMTDCTCGGVHRAEHDSDHELDLVSCQA